MMAGTFGPCNFRQACAAAGIPVSRETMEKLARYAEMLSAANEHMNLVSASTLPDLWKRHFLDSAQLVPLLPADAATIVDLGSGAGFPGLVIALLRANSPGLVVHLIDSTAKKARFLLDVATATGAPVEVHAVRAESISRRLTADVVTARACAPLSGLLDLAACFTGPQTICLFLKGQRLASELTAASETWQIESDVRPSLSDSSGQVLRVTRFRRAPASKRRRPA